MKKTLKYIILWIHCHRDDMSHKNTLIRLVINHTQKVNEYTCFKITLFQYLANIILFCEWVLCVQLLLNVKKNVIYPFSGSFCLPNCPSLQLHSWGFLWHKLWGLIVSHVIYHLVDFFFCKGITFPLHISSKEIFLLL